MPKYCNLAISPIVLAELLQLPDDVEIVNAGVCDEAVLLKVKGRGTEPSGLRGWHKLPEVTATIKRRNAVVYDTGRHQTVVTEITWQWPEEASPKEPKLVEVVRTEQLGAEDVVYVQSNLPHLSHAYTVSSVTNEFVTVSSPTTPPALIKHDAFAAQASWAKRIWRVEE